MTPLASVSVPKKPISSEPLMLMMIVPQGSSPLAGSVHSLGEAIRFVANAFPNYDISTVTISCGDSSIPRLGRLGVKALWREYGERWRED